MSAEILRRAAKVLRERADALVGPWRDQPWRVVQSDTENEDAIAVCGERTEHSADDEDYLCDSCYTSGEGGLGHATVADYVALMHPPVALALAEWLERLAGLRELAPDPWPDAEPDAVARAILREEP